MAFLFLFRFVGLMMRLCFYEVVALFWGVFFLSNLILLLLSAV